MMIQKQVSLVPSPTPSFSSLLSTVLSSDEKLGVGLGTRLEVASFPGLYHSFCRLQYENRGEGLEGFRT